MKRLILIAGVVTAMSAPARTSELASLGSATEWINSPPLTAEGLRGRVVLIQFWTYTCVNWIRTLPYVLAWEQKYRDMGLVVIGVHAPEFGFEHDLANVRWATGDFRIGYPVAVDNDFAIWRAFGNRYWPALYLIDGEGRIRYRHFGEEAYEESEQAIRELLIETGSRGVARELVSVTPHGADAAADWANIRTPETYVGSARSANQVSAGERLRLNQWALDGDWTVQRQAAVLDEPDGRMTFRFHARDLNLVMTPGRGGKPVRFRVLIDGRPPGPAHGLDVNEQGSGVVDEPRLYQLIRQGRPVTDRHFEIRFLDAGVEAFVFTFG